MKCIVYNDMKQGNIIVRTANKTAAYFVDKGRAEYCSKETWKKHGRKYMEKGAK